MEQGIFDFIILLKFLLAQFLHKVNNLLKNTTVLCAVVLLTL